MPRLASIALTLLALAALPAISLVSAATSFPDVQLLAKSAYVLDLSTGEVLWQQHGEAQLPLASLTKLMTTYAAARAGVSDQEQSCFTLVTSSNDEAELIGQSLGSTTAQVADKMSSYARELGLTQTFYLNPTGLDINVRLAGAYGSARDQASLLSHVYREYPELLRCTTSSGATFGDKSGPNTNKELRHMTGIVGSKTGLTDLAGGNLGIIFDAAIEHPVAIVVLGSTEEGRFTDVELLIDATLKYLGNS